MKMSAKRDLPNIGEVYRHFKGKYYIVLNLAHHSETHETLVVYRAMYAPHKVCARPVEMFLSEVDREKYPDADQEYRFENCGNAWGC